MAWFERRNRPLSSAARARPMPLAGRIAIALFLLLWSLGFGGGGVMILFGTDQPNASWPERLFAIPFLLGGLVGLFFAFRILWGRGKEDASVTPTEPRAVLETGVARGPQTLRPTTSRGCLLLFLVPFTAIWVGVSASLILGLDGDDPIGWVFGLVFGTVSVVLMLVTLHRLLGLTNPRVELDLPQAELEIGATTTLAWRLVGNTARLESLTVDLIGREEASYSRGTKRYTDRHEFARVRLIEVPAAPVEGSGRVDVRLPDGAVPSLDGRSNKVVWCLRYHAPTRRGPDDHDSIVVPVGPPAEPRRRSM